MKRFYGFERGMGIGGWLTNYKRFNVLPNDIRMEITVGDMEHFESYITKRDVDYIASLGFDHIRLGFDQIVLEDAPYHYRERIFELIKEFVDNCRNAGLNVVLNLHKSIGNYCDIQEEVTLFDSEELQDRFIALWLEFEKRFASYPEVAFELLNEVRDINPAWWNDLATKAVDALRIVNKERKIIVGSISWNSCHELDKLVLFDDENIIYTFHMYEPF
jgi:aryl-phospho-beta-D-glucosidase BglC (GH1 family)